MSRRLSVVLGLQEKLTRVSPVVMWYKSDLNAWFFDSYFMLPSYGTHFVFGVWSSVYPGVQHLWGYVVWNNTYEPFSKKKKTTWYSPTSRTY